MKTQHRPEMTAWIMAFIHCLLSLPPFLSAFPFIYHLTTSFHCPISPLASSHPFFPTHRNLPGFKACLPLFFLCSKSFLHAGPGLGDHPPPGCFCPSEHASPLEVACTGTCNQEGVVLTKEAAGRGESLCFLDPTTCVRSLGRNVKVP